MICVATVLLMALGVLGGIAVAEAADLAYDGALVSPSGGAYSDGQYWVVFAAYEAGGGDSPVLVHSQLVQVAGGKCSAALESSAARQLAAGSYRLVPLQAIAASAAAQGAALPTGGDEPEAVTPGLNADMVDSIHAKRWPTADHLLPLGSDAKLANRALHMGHNQGLNADMVDGKHASGFAIAAHNHDPRYVNVTGDAMSGALAVTVGTGTAPFAVTSTTLCANLNSDMVDGLHAADLQQPGPAFDDRYVDVAGDTMTGQLQSSVAEGTAPISVASTTECPNLNAALLNGLTAAQIVGNASVPSGTIVMWSGVSIPAGWHRFTALDGLFPRGAATYGGGGGAATHTHTYSGVTDIEGMHSSDTRYYPESGPKHCHDHGFGGTTASGSSLPPYLDVIFIQKD